MIFVSPGPHMAHPHSPRGSCVPMFPQSSFLMVPMSLVSLPVPVASPCPHGPDIPMSVPVSPRSPFAAVPISPVFPQHLPRVPTVSPHCPPVSPGGAGAVPARGRGGGGADATEHGAGAGAGGAPGAAAEPCPGPATSGGTTGSQGPGEGGGFIGTCKSGDTQSPGDTVETSSPREDCYRNIGPGGDSIGTCSSTRYVQSPGGHYGDINPRGGLALETSSPAASSWGT